MSRNNRTFLLISAHPDDDSLIGGTMAKLARHGWLVHEFVCTQGQNGNTSGEDKAMTPERREREAELFCSRLGIRPPYVYPNPAPFLEVEARIVTELVRYLRCTVRPDVTVLMGIEDYHFAHITAHCIGLQALEIAFRASMPELGERLTQGIILQADGLNVLNNPFIYFNIDDTFDLKMRAAREAYGERLGEHLLQYEAGLAQARGARVRYQYAEAFDLLKPRWYKFNQNSAEILAEFVRIGSS